MFYLVVPVDGKRGRTEEPMRVQWAPGLERPTKLTLSRRRIRLDGTFGVSASPVCRQLAGCKGDGRDLIRVISSVGVARGLKGAQSECWNRGGKKRA